MCPGAGGGVAAAMLMLPAELWTMVFERVGRDEPTLLAVRATCRYLRDCVARHAQGMVAMAWLDQDVKRKFSAVPPGLGTSVGIGVTLRSGDDGWLAAVVDRVLAENRVFEFLQQASDGWMLEDVAHAVGQLKRVDAAGLLRRAQFQSFEFGWPSSILGGLSQVDLWTVSVEDVSGLASCQQVVLFDCERVRDVSMLGGLDKLVLWYVPWVTDVSALGRVRELRLRGLELLSDISALGAGNEIVTITSCHSVTDFSSLARVSRVEIRHCDGLQSVAPLRACARLTIEACDNIADGQVLLSRTEGGLVLRNCANLTNIGDRGGPTS